jgi:exopolysaccharide biosynthesis polyprenyl glycosylphosphotransferase
MTAIDLAFALDRRRGASSRSRSLGAVLLLADLISISIATMLATEAVVGVQIAYVAVVLFCSILGGCYRQRLTSQFGQTLPRFAACQAIAAVLFGATGAIENATAFARGVLVGFALSTMARGVAIGVYRSVVRHVASPVVILGAGQIATRLASHLQARPEYGLDPAGFVDDGVDAEGLPLPLLGGSAELEQIVRDTRATAIIIAFGRTPEHEVVDVLRRCHELDVEVWVVPRFFELGVETEGASHVWGTPMAQLPRRALRGPSWRAKRVFDVVVSLTALVFTAPLLLLIGLAVKLTSKGPVLFSQERVGQRGQLFQMLKFRTMMVNEDSSTTWSVTEDERVTRVGRILRPTSLDELPQLINVLRGDMSLVGPRPERPHFAGLFADEVQGYEHRHRVPGGMTGLAQVNGLRGDTSIEDRATFDNQYIERWSLWNDVLILARTATALFRPPDSIRPIGKSNGDRSAAEPATTDTITEATTDPMTEATTEAGTTPSAPPGTVESTNSSTTTV